jgi:YD repeat-containing protein
VTADYTYDGLERLAIRTTQNMTPAGTTHYVYDLAGRLLVEVDDNGQTLREYVWLDDMPLAVVSDVNTMSCRFRKLHPLDSRTLANQNMIAGCSLLPSFSSACCATVSSRDDGLKPKSWCCGINSTSCSSARHVGYI